ITNIQLHRWYKARPIAKTGFTLEGLLAKTHLVGISVKCKNEKGWSDPSNVVDGVWTHAPDLPSTPEFFQLESVEADKAILTWREP
ncbi:unnamed protein product, partial [Choristocarpus tenellus]